MKARFEWQGIPERELSAIMVLATAPGSSKSFPEACEFKHITSTKNSLDGKDDTGQSQSRQEESIPQFTGVPQLPSRQSEISSPAADESTAEIFLPQVNYFCHKLLVKRLCMPGEYSTVPAQTSAILWPQRKTTVNIITMCICDATMCHPHQTSKRTLETCCHCDRSCKHRLRDPTTSASMRSSQLSPPTTDKNRCPVDIC